MLVSSAVGVVGLVVARSDRLSVLVALYTVLLHHGRQSRRSALLLARDGGYMC